MNALRAVMCAALASVGALVCDVAHAEQEDTWRYGLIVGGVSRHYNTLPGERRKLNENQRSLGVEALSSSGLMGVAAYYRDSFDGDAVYAGIGKLWTYEFGSGDPTFSISGGGVAAVTYRRTCTWWRDVAEQPAAASQKKLIGWPAPLLRITAGPVSLSTTVTPKIAFGGKVYNNFTVLYTQLSISFP